MATLGYAPNDYCGFYHFLSTSKTGQFSDDLLRALLPMCVPWTTPQYPNGGYQTDPGDSGNTGSGSTGGTGSGSTDPGETGSGSTGTGGSSGGGSTGGGSTGGGTLPGGGGGFEDPGSGGGNGEDPGTGEEDPFGTGSAMATPEPVSLILLGTGLAGIGGARMVRRRRSKLED